MTAFARVLGGEQPMTSSMTAWPRCAGDGPARAEGSGRCPSLAGRRARFLPTLKPPIALRGDTPLGLNAVIVRCLSREPAVRFASADDLLALALTALGLGFGHSG